MYCLEYLTTDQLNKLFASCKKNFSESEWILPDHSDLFSDDVVAVGGDDLSSYYGHAQFKEDFKEVCFIHSLIRFFLYIIPSLLYLSLIHI